MKESECKKKLLEIEGKFKGKTDEEMCKLMSEAYREVKIATENEKSPKKINELSRRLSFIRWSAIPSKSIICKSNFDYYIENKKNEYKQETDEDFLKFLILLIRKRFMEKYISKYIKDINEIDLADTCLDFSELVKGVCDFYCIDCIVVKIDAGFSKQHEIFQCHGYHYFDIVTFKDKKYIVDCSYRQFFSLRRNIPECLGVMDFDTLNLGYYMVNSSEKREIAEKIVKEGFIELTEHNFKHYLDGFTLSFRNGLFYEQNGGLTCDTCYTYDDYIKLLFYNYDLIQLEGRENLGFQKKPLKNPKFEFKIK